MSLYHKYVFAMVLCIAYSNKLKISGPLLASALDCGCLTSCSSSSGSGSKILELDISSPPGTGLKRKVEYATATFTTKSGFSINVVKEKRQDATKHVSKEAAKDKSQDDTKVIKDEYNIIWKTDKKEEYASKVTIEYYEAILTIFIGSGETNKIVFNMVDGVWKQNTSESTHKSNTTDTSGTTGTGTGTTATNQTAGGTTGTGSSGGGSTQKSTPTTQ